MNIEHIPGFKDVCSKWKSHTFDFTKHFYVTEETWEVIKDKIENLGNITPIFIDSIPNLTNNNSKEA